MAIDSLGRDIDRCIVVLAVLLPSPRCLSLLMYRLSLARPVSSYSAYTNRLSLHLSPSAVLVSFACKPATEATLEIISEDSSRCPSHANAKPRSSLLSYHYLHFNTRMAGITRDESDGFAARGCLRYQTKILIPSAFICCRAVHLRAAVIALRYMHVL